MPVDTGSFPRLKMTWRFSPQAGTRFVAIVMRAIKRMLTAPPTAPRRHPIPKSRIGPFAFSPIVTSGANVLRASANCTFILGSASRMAMSYPTSIHRPSVVRCAATKPRMKRVKTLTLSRAIKSLKQCNDDQEKIYRVDSAGCKTIHGASHHVSANAEGFSLCWLCATRGTVRMWDWGPLNRAQARRESKASFLGGDVGWSDPVSESPGSLAFAFGEG